MNPAISTIGRGTCSWRSPRSSSVTGVVAASVVAATTPSVALASTFHAAHRPGSESDTPSTSTRGDAPNDRQEQGEGHERQLDPHPPGHEPGRQPGHGHRRQRQQRLQAERPHGLPRRRDHREDVGQRADELGRRRHPVQRPAARQVEGVGPGVAPAHAVVPPSAPRRRARTTRPPPTAKVTATPTRPAATVPQALSDPSIV